MNEKSIIKQLTPIGSLGGEGLIIPNHSGLTGNLDAKNKLNAEYLRNDGDTATGNYNFDNYTLFIDSNNDVIGIGTSTPDTDLEIAGTSPGIKFRDVDSTVSVGQNLGRILFECRDNAEDSVNATIYAIGDTTTGGMSLTFGTGDRAEGAPERIRITSNGQVGIGTSSPNASSILDLTSTTGALILPRMTTTQRNALTAVNGMIIYNSTDNKFQGYENSSWTNLI